MILSTLAVAVAGMKNRVRGWFASKGQASDTPSKPATAPKPAMQLDTRLLIFELNTSDWVPDDAHDRPLLRMTFPMLFRDAFDMAVMLNRRTMLAPKLGDPGGNLHWFAVVRTNARMVGYCVLKVAIRGGWTPHSEYAMPAGMSGQLMSYGDAKEQCRQFNAKVMADGVVAGKFQWMMPVRPLWDPRETSASC